MAVSWLPNSFLTPRSVSFRSTGTALVSWGCNDHTRREHSQINHTEVASVVTRPGDALACFVALPATTGMTPGLDNV
jgi:hypothetical protein